ncbi:MAG: hypothetical protein RL141_371 [Candidatus Parcubacteria bacterium]
MVQGSSVQKPKGKTVRSSKRPTETSASGILRKRGDIIVEYGVIPREHLRRIGHIPNVWELTVEHEAYPIGTIFVPNRKLMREKGLTHMAYPGGLVSVLRGMLYASEQLGVIEMDEGGEIFQLRTYGEVIRVSSSLLRSTKYLSEDGRAMVRAGLASLERSLNGVQDPDKRLLARNVLRGMSLYDALGRLNIPAATLALGAALFRVQRRRETINQIGRVYVQYAAMFATMIDRQHQFAEDLSLVLQRGADVQALGFLRGVNVDALQGKMTTSKLLIEELKRRCLTLVSHRPFHGFQERVLLRLNFAYAAAQAADRQRFEHERAGLIYQAEWALIQYELEVGLLAPLGLLLRRLERKRLAELGRVPPTVFTHSEEAMRCKWEDAPKTFTAIERRCEALIARMKQQSHEWFAPPFWGEATDLCHEALTAMLKRRNYPDAKLLLKRAAALF